MNEAQARNATLDELIRHDMVPPVLLEFIEELEQEAKEANEMLEELQETANDAGRQASLALDLLREAGRIVDDVLWDDALQHGLYEKLKKALQLMADAESRLDP